MKQKNRIYADPGAAMPRKAEPFGHFSRTRLLFSNVFLKLPLSEKAIIRAFSRGPHRACDKYSNLGADENTRLAISAAVKNFDAAMAADFEPGKEIQLEISKLATELESMQMKRVSISITFLRLKHYLGNSEKDSYADSLESFDAEIRADKKRLLHLKRMQFEVKKAAAMPSAIESLKSGLKSAKELNKSEIFAD